MVNTLCIGQFDGLIIVIDTRATVAGEIAMRFVRIAVNESLCSLVALSLASGLLAYAPSRVWSQSPIAYVAGETTGAVVDRLRSGAQEIIKDADKTFNIAMAEQARRILAMLDAFEASNKRTLNLAFSKLDEASQNMFAGVSTLLDQLKQERATIVTQVQGVTAAVSTAVGGIPFADVPADIYFYSPAVIAPSAKRIVDLKFVGPRLGDANLRLAESALKAMAVNATTATESVVEIERSQLAFPKTVPEHLTIPLLLDQYPTVWWKPWTWVLKGETKRAARVLLLPERLAAIKVQTYRKEQVWELRGTLPFEHEGEGKDTTSKAGAVDLPDALMKKGWRFRLDENGQLIGLVIETAPGAIETKCVGLNGTQASQFGFTVYTAHGHKTNNAGNKRAVKGACKGSIQMWEEVEKEYKAESFEGTLSWLKPLEFVFNVPAHRYEATIDSMGRPIITIGKGMPSPRQYIQIDAKQGGEGVVFTPRPEDF